MWSGELTVDTRRRGRSGEQGCAGTECQFGKMAKSWSCTVGWPHNVSDLNVTELCAPKQ